MDGSEQKERRVERVQFETDRHRIVGDVTLPPEGYQSRFSDSLNRADVDFIPLVDVEDHLARRDGDVERRPFIVALQDATSGSPIRSMPGEHAATVRAAESARLGASARRRRTSSGRRGRRARR